MQRMLRLTIVKITVSSMKVLNYSWSWWRVIWQSNQQIGSWQRRWEGRRFSLSLSLYKLALPTTVIDSCSIWRGKSTKHLESKRTVKHDRHNHEIRETVLLFTCFFIIKNMTLKKKSFNYRSQSRSKIIDSHITSCWLLVLVERTVCLRLDKKK
jgi:hypothetical protein